MGALKEAFPLATLEDPQMPSFPAFPRLLLLLLAVTPLVSLPEGSQAQHPPFSLGSDPLPLDPAVRSGTLENGLRYYVRENRRPEGRAELRLVVSAGSVLEEEDQLGLAHFLEHMAFNGTESFPKLELVKYLEAVGMTFGPEVNAYTGFDETVYLLQIPTDDLAVLEVGIRILQEWAHRVTLEGEEIEKERGVVVEEWRQGRGASARMLDRQLPVLLRGSRYAERLPIGRVEILQSFPHEALRRFYRDWYRPDLMAVVAVGDFDGEAVEELIRERFAAIPHPNRPRPRPEFPVPTHADTLMGLAKDPEATTSQVALLFKENRPSPSTAADYRNLLVEELAIRMLDGRLFELTRQEDPPVAAAGTGKDQLVRGTRFFQIAALVKEGGLGRGLQALAREGERVARFGFLPSELERAKSELLREMEQRWLDRDNQPSGLFADQLVAYFLEQEPAPGIAFEFEAARALLPGIALEEVTEALRRWIRQGSLVVLVSAPLREGSVVPSEAELLEVLRSVATEDLAPYQDAGYAEALLPNPPSPRPVVKEETIPEVGVTVWTLGNGVRVVFKPTPFREDEIMLQAFRPGGYSRAAVQDHFSALLSAQIVAAGGVGNLDAVDLQKKLAGKAVSLTPYISELFEGFTGKTSPRDVETLLQLVYLYFTAPRRDEVAFRALQAQLDALLTNRGRSPLAAFQDTLTVTMGQGHPRARPLSPEALREVDLDRSYRFFRQRFAGSDDFTFVWVGALDLQEIRPLVERYLGGLPVEGRREGWEDLGIRPPAGVVEKRVVKGMEPQSRTVVVFTGPFDDTPEDRLGMRILGNILETRLRERLREEMGGTYGVTVETTYDRFPYGRYTVSVGFGSDPQRVEELSAALFHEIRTLQEQGPTADQVLTARQQERRSRESDQQENTWWVAQLSLAYQKGTDPRLLADLSLLDRVVPEKVRENARRWLNLDRYVRVTLWPEGPPAANP